MFEACTRAVHSPAVKTAPTSGMVSKHTIKPRMFAFAHVFLLRLSNPFRVCSKGSQSETNAQFDPSLSKDLGILFSSPFDIQKSQVKDIHGFSSVLPPNR